MKLNGYQQMIFGEFDYPEKGNNLTYPILELIEEVGALSKSQVASLRESSNEIFVNTCKPHLSKIAKLLFVICEEMGIKFEELL